MRSGERPTWGAIADALGHCVLAFLFVPTLAALPRWILFELGNPLNREEPVVLAFVPVRGAVLLLNRFHEGLLPGLLAGLLAGILLCLWVWWMGSPSLRIRRLGLGALAGAVAAALTVLGTLAFAALQGRPSAVPAAVVAFELASGALCGTIAGPTALRLASAYREPTRASASQ